MKVEYKSDHPVTDAACQKATGKTLKAWFKELDGRGADSLKRRDTVGWLYAKVGEDIWWATTIYVEHERAKGVVNKKDGRIEGYNICVTKTIAASPAEVYAAWSSEGPFRKWFGDKLKAQVAAGGAFQDAAGNKGEFLWVRENKDLRFTWTPAKAEASTLVDVTFTDKGKGKTLVTLMHSRIQNRAEADGLRAAWSAAFDALKELVEASN